MPQPLVQRQLKIDLASGDWHESDVDQEAGILGPVDYGWKSYVEDSACFTLGEGLLAGSNIPGARRMVACAHSPQWDGFYISSLGGAAYTFNDLGIHYLHLSGARSEPSVLLLQRKAGELQVRFEPLNPRRYWQGFKSRDGERLVGFFALQQYLFERYASEYPAKSLRILTLGPGSENTPEGIIGSSPLGKKGELSAVVDWCGRGGLGSRLYQQYGIAAIIFGGDFEDTGFSDRKEMDGYFRAHFGESLVKADMAFTEKYRYHAKFQTGGTFGVNMHEVSDRILSFNYQSINATPGERLQQHRQFVLDHYLRQFNEETIAPKSFEHCGEPCAVACKKLRGRYKKDYEPYHALGPQTGVFDQRAAEVLNDYVDAMGLDAIQTGGTLAWIMELVRDGLIEPSDFGFPPARELAFEFASSTDQFDLPADSERNARYAMAVLDAILNDERAVLFRQGIRGAAHTLDQLRGDTEARARAVYLSHGERGYMVPNQYWVPGMVSPMPMMGKYYLYYGPEFLAPEALGRKNVERMVYELFSDNTGVCRFHRKWSETITDSILEQHYGLELDYKAHQFALAREIHAREGHKSRPWECQRLVDMVVEFLRYWKEAGLRDEQLDAWWQTLEADRESGARAFWQAILDGQNAAFEKGADAIVEMLTPLEQEQKPRKAS